MEPPDDAFIVAVKREKRSAVPREWIEIVRGTPGITVVGEANPTRIHVKGSPEALEAVRCRLDEYVHIEKVMPRLRY